MTPSSLDPVFLAGPTAVGKSDAALHLAGMLKGEIISVDSMQVYRGLDLGTAKPSAEDRQRVPHHLIDVVGWEESFDAARFRALAQTAVAEIQGRGRVPLFCGGTGLYFQAFRAGLGSAPPADPLLRAQLEATPLTTLLEEIEKGDPEGFARLDRSNPRRVIRAVEILRLTGRPPSTLRATWAPALPSGRNFVLYRDPGDLRRRMDVRVDRIFERGLVAETRLLLDQGLRHHPTALQALGYRQVVEHLEGKRSLAETIQLVKIRTWQFARRQLTWFRRHQHADWLHIPADESAAATAHRLIQVLPQTPATPAPVVSGPPAAPATPPNAPSQ